MSSTLRQTRMRPCDSRSIRSRSDTMPYTAACAAVISTAGGDGTSLKAASEGALPLPLVGRAVEGTKIANSPPANPPCRALGRSRWPLASPSRKAPAVFAPPRRGRRNRTSLCPAKIGTRPGVVKGNAALQTLSGVTENLAPDERIRIAADQPVARDHVIGLHANARAESIMRVGLGIVDRRCVGIPVPACVAGGVG